MRETVFISYRRDAVGKAFARALKNALEHRGYDAFLDVDCIDAGQWASQILAEIPRRAHFLLLLTPGALNRCADAGDWVRREFELALKTRRNIVPVREESVDLATMRRVSPEAMQAAFDLQVADLRHASFDADIEALTRRYIAAHPAPEPATSGQPDARPIDISRIVKYAPADLIGRESETKLLSDAWDKVVRGETKRPHVLTFVALGGEGKTSLVAKWAAELAAQDWPGCVAAFAWSFYSQGTREQLAASSDLFLKEALTFFGDDADIAFATSPAGALEKGQRLARIVGQRRSLLILDGLEPLQYSPASTAFKPGELKDQGLAALLKGLAAVSHGLCVVTTRYAVPDLRAFHGNTVREERLTRLSTDAGVALLQSFGLRGSLRRTLLSADGRTVRNEFEQLVEDVKGHALTLSLLGSYLRDAHGGDIRRRDLINLEEADAEQEGGHAFRVMDAYVRAFENGGETEKAKGRRALALLRLLGLFDRPTTADCLTALLQAPAIVGLTEPLVGLAEAELNLTVARLELAKLLNNAPEPFPIRDTVIRQSLDAHPLLREYFGRRLLDEQPEAFRLAHGRLYGHLCATTEEGDQPMIDDLQPLYQALSHGCKAGMHADCLETYSLRLRRVHEHYTTTKLGAWAAELAALSCFFDVPWQRVSQHVPEYRQAWLQNEVAVTLRALGRIAEASEPMRAALEFNVAKNSWDIASVCAGNLSELEATSGQLAAALLQAELGVAYADCGTDLFRRMGARATRGEVLRDMGRRAEAALCFREAEGLQATNQPEFPKLHSVAGFQYCDLLLVGAEQAAWRRTLEGSATSDKSGCAVRARMGSDDERSIVEAARAVAGRGTEALNWVQHVPSTPILTIALDHLTLGRAALYSGVHSPEGGPYVTKESGSRDSVELSTSPLTFAAAKIDVAVSGLRRSGRQDHTPRGLLTRAWLRRATGSGSAQADLDEAWEIAERGPMPLFMADTHLHRARLFFREADYPWESPQHDLGEARRLIFKHGYLRRKEELEDAEDAIASWFETHHPTSGQTG